MSLMSKVESRKLNTIIVRDQLLELDFQTFDLKSEGFADEV